LHLAAFAADRCADGAEITLTDIVDGVGYPTDAERDAHGQLRSGTTEWETVRKMVQRDLGDLRKFWGIRLDYDDAAHSYRLAPPFLTPGERRALLAAVATVAVQGAPEGEPGELGATLDDRRALVVLRLHDLVATLRAAIGERREVTFRLYGMTRHVQPYALGMWRNRWYLAGHDLDRGTLRRYRLERVEVGEPTIVVAPGAGAYEIPADFDVDAAFDLDPNVWGQDPVLAARVRVGIDHVDVFRGELGGEVAESDGRSAIVELDVRHYQSFRDRLLAFRGSAVVLEPPELVAVVREHLAALAGDG
jgi:predicted DNA-binding transcriptional regulator YafY